MGSFPFTAADVVATYKKHGVKAIPRTWQRSEECMCPLSIMACDKLAGDDGIVAGMERLNTKYPAKEAGTTYAVENILGLKWDDLIQFICGFDRFEPSLNQPYTDGFILGVETRKAVEAAGLLMPE